ncbi:hypothetical protein GW17_00043450 [Ensete ventricosum]|nr:hypothetical protein GW17_00043450 [Ensete ventricosum]
MDAALEHSADGYVIYIKERVYKEMVRVPFEKTNLIFMGDRMGKTIITGSLNANTVGVSSYNTATVLAASAPDDAVRGIHAAATPGRHHLLLPSEETLMAAKAILRVHLNSLGLFDHRWLHSHACKFLAVSIKARLCPSSRVTVSSITVTRYLTSSACRGQHQVFDSYRVVSTSPATSLPSSTFVFGNSVIVFRDHLIFVLPRQLNPEHDESNTVTAHDRTDPAQSTDFVFDHCTINRSDEYLGMPWKEYSRAVFIDCNSAEIVRPEGWLPWTSDFTLHTLFYGEFGSSSPGANAITRVSWSSQISTDHLGAYPENLVQNGINGYPLVATASTSVNESLIISRKFVEN